MKGEWQASIRIHSSFQLPPYSILEGKKKWRASKNSVTYDEGAVRYNDYGGTLLSRYDYTRREGRLWSLSLERLHEVTYLMILSLTGKKLDLLGLHKIHAMGAVVEGTAVIGMMDTGVGKSTLLAYLLTDSSVELLSDDCPLIDCHGRVHPFPLRLGLGLVPKDLAIKNASENIYHLERKFYGRKRLLCLSGLKNPVGRNYRKALIFQGRRGTGEDPIIVRKSPLHFFMALMKHMALGVGLPIIFEYFWRRGFSDFCTKAEIAFLRLRLAFLLVNEHDFYEVSLGTDPKKNAQALRCWVLRP